MPREKDGWLICDEPRGGGRCRGRIASIDEMERLAPDAGGVGRVLHILPGWQRDRNRVWHEPPNAINRRQRGYPPRLLPGSVSGMKRSRGPSYKAPMFEPTRRGWLIKLRCSDCQHVHELDADALNVARLPPHAVYTEKEHKAP